MTASSTPSSTPKAASSATPVKSSSAVASSVPPVVSSSKTSSSAPTSAASGLPGGFAYKGCYIDNANGRVLPNENDNAQLTVESCITYCTGLGYSVAGMEYSTQCFCGNAIYSGGALAPQDSDCNMPCGGNAKEMCGAGNRLSIYSNATLTTYQPAKAQTSGLPGSWTYDGCYK